MINNIRIQNFKSIRDVELKNLQKVNLFIGPNNSGKSNFLKGIEFLGRCGKSESDFEIKKDLTYQKKGGEIRFKINEHDFKINNSPLKFNSLHIDYLDKTIIYSPQPEKFKEAAYIQGNIDSNNLESDAKNLVEYLIELKENPDDSYFDAIEKGLADCVKEFKQIKIPKITSKSSILQKQIQFVDENKIGYMADEVSDGVLYFLALLCIVNQPNPPKLLMLEEPEKGIHPRRISEVLDYIFLLAEKKDIQVIISSHSVGVVDYFSDMPEAVYVFDKVNGETQVKNLQTDIIEPKNKNLREQNLPEIKFTESLGEHWSMGFLGGVPE
ncbi:MAG: hypothetical protein RIQ33_294 [Bacteroidota bacterium]|jgi:predicted ATPase